MQKLSKIRIVVKKLTLTEKKVKLNCEKVLNINILEYYCRNIEMLTMKTNEIYSMLNTLLGIKSKNRNIEMENCENIL